tara:strand:- start:581 stop:2422 length:1842 start_codon:yes stop_codon:yes gene_type:complete
MCGIAGIVNINNSKIDPGLVSNLSRSLEHRGPDNSSIHFISDSVALVHTRLSIIDLNDRSNQPFSSKDNRYSIVFNGEIYNYREIRKDLEGQGVNFTTEGDTEVLLEGFIHYGSDILRRLRGQFAFAVYDSNEGSFFLARDRIGIKPLYFAKYKEWFIFGSEMKSIEQSKIIPFSPDLDSYITYLRHLAVPKDRTGNSNISKLEPGEYIEFSSEGEITKNRYWDPFSFKINNDITKQEAIDTVGTLLEDAVSYRKVSDVEVGLFLSGGIDSSLIGKLMKENEESGLKGFNIDYQDHFQGYEGEVEEATFASSTLGFDLIKEQIQYSDFQDLIENYSFYQDDLIGDEVGIPLYFLGKMTRENDIKVVQVGEGADELFYGYDHWLRFMKLNKFLRPIVSERSDLFKMKNHRLNLVSNILFNRTSFAGGALGFNLNELDHLIDGGIPNESELVYYVDNKWDDYFQSKEAKLSKWMTLIDLQIRLPELLLMRMDKLTMQSAVEARVPFLDHHLVEYVLTIPENVIYDRKTTKPLLKKVAQSHIPEKIINRKKQGFRAPIGEWLKKDEDYFYEGIKEFNLLVNLFSEKEINRILAGNDFQKKWYLVNLARWHLTRVAN